MSAETKISSLAALTLVALAPWKDAQAGRDGSTSKVRRAIDSRNVDIIIEPDRAERLICDRLSLGGKGKACSRLWEEGGRGRRVPISSRPPAFICCGSMACCPPCHRPRAGGSPHPPRGRPRRLMGRARMRSRATGETAHLFGETRYAARKWKRQRRVIVKGEVVRHPGRAPKNNPRFLVTNLPHTPEHVYGSTGARGDVENRIKELEDGLALDRLRCSRFRANQFRLLLTTAAYILFQALRLAARGTAWATVQVTTLRERLLKIGGWLEQSVRRIVMHVPAAFAWRREWSEIARAVGATP